MTGLDFAQTQKLDALQMKYVNALDSKDMAGWLDCFSQADEASYVCAAKENVDAGLPMALMLDDCRARLLDRVTFVTQIWHGTFQDYQARHFVQALSVEQVEGGRLAVRSNFSLLQTSEASGISSLLVAGIYEDVVDMSGDEARFLSRRAILDTNVQPRYLVYPV